MGVAPAGTGASATPHAQYSMIQYYFYCMELEPKILRFRFEVEFTDNH